MLRLNTPYHSGFLRPPNSGPGGRRFKSSLPDQCFQLRSFSRCAISWDPTFRTPRNVGHPAETGNLKSPYYGKVALAAIEQDMADYPLGSTSLTFDCSN